MNYPYDENNENKENSVNNENKPQENNWSQPVQYTQSPYTPGNSNVYWGNVTPQQTPPPPRKKKKWVWIMIVSIIGGLILLAALGFGTRMLMAYIGEIELDVPISEAPTTLRPHVEVEEAPDIPYTTVRVGEEGTLAALDVVQVVEDTMPAMVSIDVLVTQTYQDPFGGFGGYFGFGSGYSYEQDVPGSGSGIIIGQNDTELLIVTNNHVVGNAKEIAVKFIDEESVNAYTKGTDPSYDLAVIAVPIQEIKQETLESIKIAVMGDSDALRLGEPAVAIGNALGYGQSVTVGYISALRREVNLTDGTMTLIQTDAAINPGNSGGALLNMRGEVIGINSAKYSDTDVEGMGYAIPITDAIPIINELMNSVVVPESERPFLGIMGQTVPESYRKSLDWPEGVYVSEITEDSPAALSGMRAGDIIVGFNGSEIVSMEQLQEQIAACEIGETVEVTVMRGKRDARGNVSFEEVTLNAVLIPRSDANE